MCHPPASASLVLREAQACFSLFEHANYIREHASALWASLFQSMFLENCSNQYPVIRLCKELLGLKRRFTYPLII